MATMFEQMKTDDPSLCVTAPIMRRRLRDLPKYNELVKQELSDDELVELIVKAIADFNGRVPFFSSYTAADFPDRSLLIDLTLCEAIDMLSEWHARNQFSAQDAGLQVPIHEQWQPLMQLGAIKRQRADQRATQLKAHLNVMRAMGGGVGSPLWLEGHGR